MAKEIKIKALRSLPGSLILPFNAMPPYLQEKVNKLNLGDDFTLTLSIPDPRGDWIEKWYKKAGEDDDVAFYFHKTATICVFRIGGGIAISDVCKGDTYDRKTGIAVAYAKFLGEPIPDFI